MPLNIILTLSLLLSLHSNSPIASQQILSQIHSDLDFDQAKKLLLRLLPLLSHQQRSLLKNLYP